MILAVEPPAYFPPPARCAKAFAADVIIHADSFQFRKQEIINRAAIKTAAGSRWLTVPVLSKNNSGARIMDLAIDARQAWAEAHWRALEYNYHNTAYFYYYADELEKVIRSGSAALGELLRMAGLFTWKSLNIKAQIVPASELPLVADRTERLLVWARACGCDRYLLWPVEADLLDLERLSAAGLVLLPLEFNMAPYHQQFSGFLPDLSILDLLFNEGPMAGEYINRNSLVRSFLREGKG